MTNSSIPAESLGSPAPVSASFLWEVPNKPVSIQISLDVVDRMEREVIDSFKAVTKRGSEVGGILLGRVAHGGKRTVFVENYEAVTCDYSRGPLYLMAEPDKERLREVLERLKASPLAAVGFFRSNTRRDLMLDEDDLALAQEFFSDPNQVFLLVKPFAMKPSTAGCFVWEDGRLQAESSLEFPFRRSELQKLHAQSIVPAGGSRAVDASPSAPPREDRAPVVFPKREERPAAVPPAFGKREETRPGPVIVPPRREEPSVAREETVVAPPPIIPKREDAAPAKTPPAPPVLPKREERPAAPPLTFKREERPPITPATRREERSAPVAPRREDRPPITPANLKREEKPAPPPRHEEQPKRDDRPPIAPLNLKREDKPAVSPRQEEPAKREERPAAQPVAKRDEVSPAPAKAEKKEEPATVVAPPPLAAAAVDDAVAVPLTSEPAKSGMARWILIALVLVLIAAAGAYFVFFRNKAATQTADAGLNLRVERNAGQLVLTWNRNAAVIANAQKSTLSILDGDHKEDVDLDLGTLRSGSIVYSPITNDVGFRLEVAGANGGAPIGESVRALAGRPSPLMQQAPLKETTPTDTKAAASQPAPTPAQPQASAPAAAPAATQAAPPVAEAAKPNAPVTLIPPRPDSLASRLRAAEPRELAEPPSLEGGSSGSIATRALPTQTAFAPPPPAAAPKPAPQTSTPAARQAQGVKVGGNVEEAVVLRRFPPTYPALARQARVYGVVRVEAVVGADGRVKRATALSGPPLLKQAAVEAVQRWQYKPGRLNGEPVEVTTQVDVSFTLNR